MTNNKKNIAKLLAVLAFSINHFHFFIHTNAETAPTLEMRDTIVTKEDLKETRNVGLDLILKNNNGFTIASFGIKYDDRLEYTDFVPGSEAGDAFEVVCNEEENLIWFYAAAGAEYDTASIEEEDNFLSIYFDIPEEIEGGNFEFNFVWTGLDGSQAFWYIGKNTDLIEKIIESTNNGRIIYCNPESEDINVKNLRLNPYEQYQLEVLNASAEPFWFSTDTNVATVNEKGLVSSIAAGTSIIYAYLNNHIMTCTVVVSDKYHYSMDDSSELELTDPDKKIVLEFPNADNDIEWFSADPDIATVDKDGTINVLKNGKAHILAKSNGITYMKVLNINFVKTRTITIPGDINGNGEVEISDVVLGNRIYVGVDKATAERIKAGDLDKSGKIDLSDTMRILRKLVGLEDF